MTTNVASISDALLHRPKLYIGGRWQGPEDGGVIAIVSPSTEFELGSAAVAGVHDIDRAVSAARTAFDSGPWPTLSAAGRADVLLRLSKGIEARAVEIEHLAGAEVGAIVSMAAAFRMSAQLLLSYYADLVSDFAISEERVGAASDATVRLVPLGVVAAVVPWNAPLPTAMYAVAPALAAGCTVVIKSPVEAPLALYLFGDIASEVGLPDGVVNIVCADREESEALVRHRGVDKVCFTGSTATGRRVAAICGERLVPVTLELGGKSAAIVLDDADPVSIATQVATTTMLNSGQACINATRVLVPNRRKAEFVAAIADAVADFRVGDPFDPATFVGPLISHRQRARVEGYIAVGRSEGGSVIVGGGRPAGLDRGYFVEATLFDDVDNSMTIAREEIFGPVTVIIGYDDDVDAVAIANDTPYGLSGNVWSPDIDRATSVAHSVRTGNIGINGTFLDWAIPFGGMKDSGLGREFGVEGLRSFYDVQSVHRSK
jgi:betaine-aldehyde dehydrogenase